MRTSSLREASLCALLRLVPATTLRLVCPARPRTLHRSTPNILRVATTDRTRGNDGAKSGQEDSWDHCLCRQIHLTRDFFSNTFTLCTHHIVAQGVFGARSFHLHVIHDVACLSVRCLFLFCLLSLPLAPQLFSHCLPVLCPAHQLPCRRNRRG